MADSTPELMSQLYAISYKYHGINGRLDKIGTPYEWMSADVAGYPCVYLPNLGLFY